MAMQLGFGVFGYPINHRFISNGLFRELNLEGETFLSLPNGVSLKKNERLIKISRQVINGNQELIKVYIFDFAIPIDDRPNGFIGTAYVFKGVPTEKLLHTSVKNLHSKIFKLLNQDSKFIDRNFNISQTELIDLNTDGLINGPPRGIIRPSNRNIYCLYTEGPVLDYLMPAVQGFMYNPNFSGLESLYVSDNRDLLLRILGNNQGNLLNIGHILNFENHFNYLNSQLEVKKNEFEELKKSIQDKKNNKDAEISEHIKKLTDQKSELDSKIKEKDDKCSKLDKDIEETEEKLNKLKKEKESTEENIKKINNEIQSLRETKKKLENENQTAFNKLINNKDFERERNNFIENSSLVKELMNEKSNLEEKIGKSEKVTFKAKVLIIGIPLILLMGSYLIGNYFPIFNKKSQPETTINESENSEKPKELAEFKPLPKEYTTKEFINLSKDKQESHKDSIDNYLDALERDKPGLEFYKFDNFFNRKWNFAELIDVDKFNPDKVLDGLDRINRIKKAYARYDKKDSVFSERFGVTETDIGFEEKDFQFESDKRNVILNKYLSQDKNIYKELGFSEYRFETGFDNLGNLDGKGDDILIYMHFRWMVYKLSGDKTDLKTTTEREHKVLFTK